MDLPPVTASFGTVPEEGMEPTPEGAASPGSAGMFVTVLVVGCIESRLDSASTVLTVHH
jgi:hypothetical protein